MDIEKYLEERGLKINYPMPTPIDVPNGESVGGGGSEEAASAPTVEA